MRSLPSIRPATERDWIAIWYLFREVVAAGDVFAYDETTSEQEARKLWFELPSRAWVIELDDRVAGTYFIRPNQPGRGCHVANAGYMVANNFRGRGLASMMCAHSLEAARELGFTAMQYNFVISTNLSALRVWERHGFAIVGRIPGAFRHATEGFVDALILHRNLS